MPDLVFPLPSSLGALAIAADSPKLQGSRWRTDLIELAVREGRYRVTASSLRMIAQATGPLDPEADVRSARVLIAAGLLRDVFHRAKDAAAQEVEVQLSASSTTLAFVSNGQRITTPVPPMTGDLPPIDELVSATKASTRRSPAFTVEPRVLGRAMKIATAICGQKANLSMTMCGHDRLRFDAINGPTRLTIVLATPPNGGAGAEPLG